MAEDWFESRGFSPETVKEFRLGVVENPLPDHEKYEGKLCIPYLDRAGRVLKVRFRCLEDHGDKKCKDFGHGKYLDLPHEHARTFNTKAVFEANEEIHCAEGELDAVTLSQLGYPAIALPGAQQWQRHHSKMLAGFERIYCWGDPDTAGADFNEAITRSMRSAQAVKLRQDINDTYLSEGVKAIEKAIGEVIW